MDALRLLLCAGLAVAAVGCAVQQDSATQAGPAPPVAAPAPDRAERATISGTIASGVETGCYVLRSGGKLYQLIGDDPDIRRPGLHVVVRGEARPGTPTTCMQGIPFHVTDARPA
ncbi:hypothetical protein A8924_3677 [Saccharopolyspora erythraea NRRL 2338]|uniref:Uncharacterized protein n=2 Tax=Saccharopolyspora erythraea TaxID=1836 RepID=A4FET4_SACEN|nr:hypothetical protein [Saccharopolyspora erythraea]EQD81544.1 hypothetical protein N599_35585 [Saccharopolyspora erythraea D]PFG96284.1 hypothetical protein A8924_3677 [Saccharopolyspora erythraea NRRL 2338]QRK92803.1 hypothetical protein JQX30_16820 [Saccharopolyspora erythraea]CAM02559.1 hypothetical protein SACE_3284 [Saccharopolyspora erythraea NRRL 2338]